MNGIDAYHIFTAMRLHFTQKKFNYVDTIGKKKKVSISVNRWRELKERERFEAFGAKFADEQHLMEYLIPAFVDTPDLFIWDIISDKERYKKLHDAWIKKKSRSIYYFHSECDEVFSKLRSINVSLRDFLFGGIICQWLTEGQISMETFIILDKLTFFLTKVADPGMLYNVYFSLIVEKYSMLMDVDVSRYSNLLEVSIKQHNVKLKEDAM